MIETVTNWTKRNDRVTFKTIFASEDRGNFGEIRETDFMRAMRRIGVSLTDTEINLLKEVLDPDQVGFLKYKPFVMRLDGVPMIQFISPELKKLAMFVVERDISAEDFNKAIDPRKVENMK